MKQLKIKGFSGKDDRMKYGNGVTTADVCELELEEMEQICSRYHMHDEDAEILKGMVSNAYYQLQKSYASGRAMERVYYERTGKQFIAEDFEKYLAYCMEEEARDFGEVPEEEYNAE